MTESIHGSFMRPLVRLYHLSNETPSLMAHCSRRTIVCGKQVGDALGSAKSSHRFRASFGMAALPPDESGFRVTLAADYPKSREYTRKYAHYLCSKGDRFRAAREYLKHLCMRN